MNNDTYVLKCFRCNYTWIKRKQELPKTCPKCRATTWNDENKPNNSGYRNGRTNTVWVERLQETNNLEKDE